MYARLELHMDDSNINRISGTAPQFMSLLALAICTMGWEGIVRDAPGDEGPLAHIYQLLMVGQIPLIVIFLATAIRRGLRQKLGVLGLQIALWITALAAVPLLGL
jgi:hypothetical protein